MYGAGGNIASARNPLGYYTYYTPDVLGRDSAVRTQIDAAGTAYEQDSTLYNLKDEAIRGVRYGPALPGAVAQRAIVQMFYDKEGRDTAVARSSVPDSAGVGTTSTWTHFDALGRVVAAIAGDHRKDSVVFDAAGNDTLAVTRRGKTIRKHFDALNRLTWRATDSVRYAGLHKGIATLQFQYAPGRDSTFPRYPNDGRGYTIAGDTATFTYNALGELLSANNSAAHVTRTYYLNGLDSTETEAVNTYHGSNFTAHVYTLKSFYDLNGRRTVLKYPDQLVGAADSAIWMYDGVTGNLATVFDLLHNAYMFQYDSLDQVHAVFAPGEIREFIHYLSDGALAADSVLNYSSSPHKYPVAVLRSTTFTYDARGKRLSAVNTSGPRPHRGMAYSGLGYLVLSADTSYDRFYDSFAQQWGLTEAMGYDALGNQTHDTKTSSNIPWPGKTNFNQATVQDMYTSDGAARLARTVTNGNDDSLTYDPAGNLAFQYSKFWGASYGHDRAAYYDADNRLRAVDDRTVETDGHQLNGYASYTFDDYRYDALGRRVLTRSRRFCNMTQSFTNRWPCLTSLIRRTVWDGNTEAAEVQMPGGDSGTTAPAMPDVVLEQDTGYAPLLAEDATAYCCYDPNPFYGRVAYTYGLALDEPVSVARYGYLEGQVPNSPPDTTHHFQPFTVSPQWDSRGAVDVGTFADGGITTCETTGSTVRCVSDILWPYGLSSYNQGLWGHVNWLGTLLEGKQDGTGLLYRRHRYVDPATGRFTQEDPIGLAGGLNAYGFAQGDPVSYADPFGLCPTPDGGDDGKPCPGPLGQIINQVNQRMDDAMAQLADLAVKFLDIFTPAGDITRASTGIDPESGKRLSTGARVASGVAAIACVAPQGDESKAVEVVFKSAHGARHLVGTGLEAAEVESAISTRILEDVAGASETGTFSGRLEVGGNLLEFRAFTVSPGEINVGTYFPNP
jgi:RHS repeat-associated protein